jgi:exopolyphosphatase/guanosine-5'-triphosphate,3'-diphosphate pyrophosphatase
MLGEEQLQYWEAAGLAMRLAYSLSAATPELLRRTGVKLSGSKVKLRLQKGDMVLNGEAVERRLEALGRIIGRSSDLLAIPGRRSLA